MVAAIRAVVPVRPRRWRARSADNETPEGTWSVAIDTDAEHRYRCLRSTPLRAKPSYRLRYGSVNPFIHEFRESAPICADLSTVRPRRRGGTAGGPGGDAPDTRKRPKKPRSLVAPINVNTDQITRCSLPLRARPTIRCPYSPRQGGYPRVSSQTHLFRGRCPHPSHTTSPAATCAHRPAMGARHRRP